MVFLTISGSNPLTRLERLSVHEPKNINKKGGKNKWQESRKSRET